MFSVWYLYNICVICVYLITQFFFGFNIANEHQSYSLSTSEYIQYLKPKNSIKLFG